MSKITISTDWHFGKSNGKFDEIILKGIYEQCQHALDSQIDIMFNLGDTLDIKQTISTTTLNYLAQAFERVNATFKKVYIIIGNHDMSKKTFNDLGHNLHIFNGYPNIELIDSPTTIQVYNKSFYMLPYFPNSHLKTHIFPEADFMMGHIEVHGFMLNQFIKAADGINKNTITKQYKRVYLGHFHKRQTSRTISYIGNMCRFFYGENDDPRGWTILDTEKETSIFVEYNHPRMFKYKLSELKDYDFSKIFREGDNLKLVIDEHLKYSELEELKSKLLITHKINNLVLDDQFYAFELDDELDELNESVELTEDGVVVVIDKTNETDPNFMTYLMDEIGRATQNNTSDKSIQYLIDKAREFQQ